MSFDYLKSIAIKDNKVYLTSAANNISPRTYERYESPYFSGIYQDGGMGQLLQVLAANVWEGNFHLVKGSKLCNLLSEATESLASDLTLRLFLDTEHAAKYISDLTLHLMDKGPAPDIKELHALRYNKEFVLEICRKNPMAFNYAGEEIRKDREVAKAHIVLNGDTLGFEMPKNFTGDKVLAMLALERNGTTYRQLAPELCADKDIVRLAFSASHDRRFYEHLPDLIPESLRKDEAFMVEVVSICPRLHVFRSPELMQSREFTKAWLNGDGWYPTHISSVPDKFLYDPEIQSIMLNKFKANPPLAARVRQQLEESAAQAPKPSLSNLIDTAENKKETCQHATKLQHSQEHSR